MLYSINIKTLETGICSIHFLEKVNDTFLVGHAMKLEALSKKRDAILHKHQTRELGVKEGGDLTEDLYETTCARHAFRASHINFEKGDYLMVAFVFSDGWCFGYSFFCANVLDFS